MAENAKKNPVKGGYIARSVVSGRFVEVGSSSGIKKATPKTASVVKEASSKRKSALKRLANR